jgi:ATP-binding cassette subfamily B protein
MINFLKYLARFWWQIILLLLGLYIQVWSSLQLPDMMSQIVNQGIVGSDQDFIISKGAEMLGVALSGGAGMVVSGWFAARIGAGLARRIRENIFGKIMSFSLAEINGFSTASLITRTTNDVMQVQQGTIMTLRMCLQAPLMGIGAVLKALETAPEMTWIIALAVGVLSVIMIVVFTFAMPKFNLLQKLIDKLNLVTRENLTGLRVIRAFNNEKMTTEKFEIANDDLTRVNLFVSRVMSVTFPTVQLILNFTLLLIIWVGATYIDSGVIEIGNMMAFIQYAMQAMMAFMFLAMAFIMIPRAVVSWKRINQVMTTKNSISLPKKPIKPNKKLRGVVEFKNASFSYPGADEQVLQNISFTADPGKTTAIIGSTGSGKSTLINLIPRFYDVSSGAVLVDGVDVRDMSSKDLMRRIGYVPQKNIVFSGTIASNVEFGSVNNSQKLSASLHTAQASDFVSRLTKKSQSIVDQGGNNLSGGQKQRLSIARAIYKNPEIYIFDDSFSALDFKTDRKLRQALAKKTKKSAILIVAQRIGSIKQADQIVVLDNGRIAGIGTHCKLLQSNKIYQEIAASQLSEDELQTEMKLASEVKHG